MSAAAKLPFVSIIMPVRNEGGYLQRALESVFHQDYPPERLEILVVDGMSTDNTRQILDKYRTAGKNLTILDNPGRIVPIGMNLAIPLTRGDILIRVDGHCEIAPGYVRKCVNYLENGLADGVGGPMESVGETEMARLIAIVMSSPFGVGNSSFRTQRNQTMFTDTVPFPAYKRSVMAIAGGYDEELVRNQDDEYNYRLRSMGYRILLAGDIHSRYYSRSTLLSLWRQYFQYGFWKVRVMQKHPRQMRLRQFIPGSLVGALFISVIVALLHPLGWIAIALTGGCYLLTNLLVSILTARKHGWKYLLLLPSGFAILHFSYGAGFLVGLVRFIRRWNDRIGRTPQWKTSDGAHGA